MPKILSQPFFLRDTVTVARELLGCTLVRMADDGSRISGRIVETEAYLGIKDAACHSFGERRTTRVQSMYLKGGHAYVYFIYGMHFCFNVVTRSEQEPEAVLIRALEPLEGIAHMESRRQVKKPIDLTNGPGKLCRALAIDKDHDGHLLTETPLYIERGIRIADSEIISSPRIGVAYAGEAASWPLRFSVQGNKYVSKR